MAEAPHKHVFWLYGIIAALAIREALATAAGPLLFEVSWSDLSFPYGPEAVQLIAIILLAATLYFGSLAYFEKAYGEGPEGENEKTAYRVDVISGLIHYIILFFWSLSLEFPNSENVADAEPPLVFLFLFAWLLLYDTVWWLFHKWAKGPKPDLIGDWAFKNFVFFVVGAAAILALHFVLGMTVRGATGLTLLPITLAIAWDFWNGAGGDLVGFTIGRR